MRARRSISASTRCGRSSRPSSAPSQRSRHDMSDSSKRWEEELEAATRELVSLTYAVSHDLRAPLRTIDGFSEALSEDYGDKLDEQAREYLSRIRSAAIAMNAMIEALAELSRVSRDQLRSEKVNISEVAQSIA